MTRAIRSKRYMDVSVDQVKPNPHQPRRDFPVDSINRLAASITQLGLIEDIVVREKDGYYELVCGERRWRAVQRAGLPTISAKVIEVSDEDLFFVSLAENLHRENLTDVRLGFIYRDFIRRGMAEERIAERLSVAERDVMRKLGLLDQSALVEYQQQEIERLRGQVEQLEGEVMLLKQALVRLQEARAAGSA